MRIRLLAIAMALAAVAAAQTTDAYVFAAPGAVTAQGYSAGTLQFGLGAEYVTTRGIGIGAEGGILGPTRNFCLRCLSVLISPDVSYHFVRKSERKLDPFVIGGYTMMLHPGEFRMFNFGAGVNYWAGEKIGLRVEFRDQLWPASWATTHYWGIRAAVAFR